MKRIAVISTAVMTAGLLVGCASPNESGAAGADSEDCVGQTLTVARSSSASLIYAVDYVAEAQGFFEEEGIVVEAIALGGGSEALQALIGGSVDITTTAFFSMLGAREEGAPVIAFASEGNRNTSEIGIKAELAPPEGSSPADVMESLRGLRVGVTSPGSSTDQTLRYLLKENGMDPEEDLEIIAVGSASSIVASFDQGSIDAFLIGPPNSAMAVERGAGVISLNIAGGEVTSLNDMMYMVAATTEQILDEKAPLLRCYADALDKAAVYANENPDEARDAIRPYFDGIDDAIFDASWESILPSIPLPSAVYTAEAEKALGFIEVVRGGDSVPDVGSAITDQFN